MPVNYLGVAKRIDHYKQRHFLNISFKHDSPDKDTKSIFTHAWKRARNKANFSIEIIIFLIKEDHSRSTGS